MNAPWTHDRDQQPTTGYELYDEVAEKSAALVIKRYSTSFGMASRLLNGPVRTRVRNIYALVRVADEIVDAPRPLGEPADQLRLIDALQAEVHESLRTGHSANLVVHAFARTARSCGIGTDLVDPFFASMRTDLFRVEHDEASFAAYVYGSAEVVGLMCLRAFLAGRPEADREYAALAPGARRLGAAFQKVNFLRDLAADRDQLGRSYFPGLDPDRFDEAARDRFLDDIDADLGAAAAVIPALPVGSRRAVSAAHALFAELSHRLRAASPERIRTERIRVPGPVKARIVARAVMVGAG
ncbi:phytoene/squalene synthase family protein [Aeromicrobium sp. 636]|uniref:Squalene/phytoene synthase family protein n=1 Tax=Aeromicrobium senzhongii TaxID=2663859 RepID=A0A8I0EX93_9ACTN|nr:MULTISPECIES: squalene/phytoene synthase family protein [Aeromicrobium]MBC9226982.1 squalene/phytoene synthase family protein [Aeromicrobium senzhongii]MCQ3999082.1 phytoene/squalene synthase family protein [Aeromicrobium sp. 636]